jgi:hypothetical protein
VSVKNLSEGEVWKRDQGSDGAGDVVKKTRGLQLLPLCVLAHMGASDSLGILPVCRVCRPTPKLEERIGFPEFPALPC